MKNLKFLCFALGIIFSNANGIDYRDNFFSDFDPTDVVRPVPIRPVLLDSEDDDFIECAVDSDSDNNQIEYNAPNELTFSVWCKDNYQYVANMVDYEMQNKTKQFYGKNMFFNDDIGDNCLGSELAEVFPNISVHDQVLKATGPFRYTENCIHEKCESSSGNNDLFSIVHHLIQIPSFKDFKNNPKSKLTISISTANSPANYLLQVTAHTI